MAAAATTALALIAATAAPQGSATLALDGTAAASLRKQGVEVVRQMRLPVQGGTLGEGASLALRGRLTLRARSHGRVRRVAFTRWRANVRAGRTVFTAVVGGKRRVVLAADVPPWRVAIAPEGGRATLRVVRVRLARGAATVIRKRLRLARRPAGVLGTAKARVTLRQQAGGGGGDGGGGSGPGGSPGGPGGSPGGPGGGGPTPPTCDPNYELVPFPPAPAPLARPAGASTVTSATIVWRPRETLIRYINAGEGTTASDGASDGPVETKAGQALVYSFQLQLKTPDSWYDPATRTAGLFTRGTVRFHYSGHGIDVRLKNPEIELNGGASRSIVTLAGAGCTEVPDMRGLMLDLGAGGVEPGGAPLSVPATLTADGAAMWSSMYAPGSEWGSFEISSIATAP